MLSQKLNVDLRRQKRIAFKMCSKTLNRLLIHKFPCDYEKVSCFQELVSTFDHSTTADPISCVNDLIYVFYKYANLMPSPTYLASSQISVPMFIEWNPKKKEANFSTQTRITAELMKQNAVKQTSKGKAVRKQKIKI